MNNSSPIIEIKNLSKSYGNKKIIDNMSLKIYENEILIIAGLSGTGKSTLLKMISGLEEPDSGEIILQTNKIGMVFQGAALFDSLSVFDNVAFPITSHKIKISHDELQEKVLEKLRMVGLSGVEDLMPDQLSGGMKKRVSFARAIIDDPKIILYDEPTSGLDPVLATVIMNYILKLKKELNATSLLVSHYLKEFDRINGRILLLYEGKLVWDGKSEDFMKTNDKYAKQFREATPEGPMQVIKS